MFGRKSRVTDEAMYEKISHWIKSTYFVRRGATAGVQLDSQQSSQTTSQDSPLEETYELVLASQACCNLTALSYIDEGFLLKDTKDTANHTHEDDYTYAGYSDYPCDIVPTIKTYFDKRPGTRTGAMLFNFKPVGEGQAFDVLFVSAWATDEDLNGAMVCIAVVPKAHVNHWLTFERECTRIANSAIPYRGKVYIIGGADVTFDATIDWDEIYLPDGLKEDILQDVDSFFKKGVDIYKRLNLKPFRKLLFAGVPGTGKTMLCSAIAKWAQAQDYFVVYVSGSNQYGARFWKIHDALDMAASSEAPTIVIVEELDAYLDDDSKAQLLNVLDGSETPENEYGTVMIATTNHPEEIDDRVMKRPGRLDRIFIIPEMTNEDDAEAMLRGYLGDQWQDEHREIVPSLLGKPGAFIREVALHALTMAAYQDMDHLPLATLRKSLDALELQIEAKDDFLTAHKRRDMGLLRSVNGK